MEQPKDTFGLDTVWWAPCKKGCSSWDPIYDHDNIVIQIASKEALLAIMLRANRPGRDTSDIRLLLRLVRMK